MFILPEDFAILSQAVEPVNFVQLEEKVNASPKINEYPFVLMNDASRARVNDAFTKFNDLPSILALNEFIQKLLDHTDRYSHLFTHQNHSQTLSIIYDRAIQLIDTYLRIPDQKTARRKKLLSEQRNCLIKRMTILSETRQEYLHQLANKNWWHRLVQIAGTAIRDILNLAGNLVSADRTGKKIERISNLEHLLVLEADSSAKIHTLWIDDCFQPQKEHLELETQIQILQRTSNELGEHIANFQIQLNQRDAEHAEAKRNRDVKLSKEMKRRDVKLAEAMKQRDVKLAADMKQRDEQLAAAIEKINMQHREQVQRLVVEIRERKRQLETQVRQIQQLFLGAPHSNIERQAPAEIPINLIDQLGRHGLFGGLRNIKRMYVASNSTITYPASYRAHYDENKKGA